MNRHIAIMGHSRAGTTMFYNMMRSSLQGFRFMDRETPADQTISRPNLSFCTKRPLDVFRIENILAANRSNKTLDVIVCLRDPRSLLTSMHKSVPDDWFMDADFMYFVDMARGIKEKQNPGLISVHNQIERVLHGYPNQYRIMLLRYEDLLDDPDGIQRKLAEGMDLDFDGSFTDFHKADIPENLTRALNGVRPVDSSNAVSWKKPEKRDRLIQQFEAFPTLFEIVKMYGYEKDDTWFEELKNGA